MKFYYSPLSIGALLMSILGLWMIFLILKGAYPTYLSFVLLGTGVLSFIIDYFIRNLNLGLKYKIIFQSTIILFIVFTGYIAIN